MAPSPAHDDASQADQCPKFCWPRRSIRISAIGRHHKARIYLESLGLNLMELKQLWNIKLCHGDPSSTPPIHNSILVPVRQARTRIDPTRRVAWHFSGWQGFPVGEPESLDGDGKTTAAGMETSTMLYGLPHAIPGDGPVVLVSRFTDVWRLGGNCVSTFGATMSSVQEGLILDLFGGRPIVVADNRNNSAISDDIRTRLRKARRSAGYGTPVSVLRLPEPDEALTPHTRTDLWNLVRRRATDR